MTTKIIYHLARQADWDAAVSLGYYHGSDEDRVDGFLHFSTGAQIEESARLHRGGETGLVLLEAESAPLGDDLKWEASRDGQAFPHLYGDLPTSAVLSATPLTLDEDGLHIFPALTKE